MNKIQDWVRFYKISQKDYKPHALAAVLRNDGPQVLAQVLKALGLEASINLVRDWVDDTGTARGSHKDVPERSPGRPHEDPLGSNRQEGQDG